jgi:hypothetical protein
MVKRNLNELAKKHPRSVYAAFYSLPELHAVFLSVVEEDAEEPWEGQPPSFFSKKIDEKGKEELIAQVAAFLSGLDPDSQGRTMHALNSWCDADALFGFAMSKWSSNQKKFEAICSVETTRGVFDSLDEKRRSSPAALAESLSPVERSRFYMKALNEVSQLSERGQLAYFSRIFGIWAE